MALIGDPDLLFLDEPTVALDVEARRRFWAHLRDLADHGRTIVFTTHYLAEADAVADRVVVIDRGQVLADGTPQQVKRLVAGRTIRFTTRLSSAQLRDLPGAVHVEVGGPVGSDRSVAGRRATVHTNDVEAVIATLLEQGHGLADLTVEEAALEDAFVHLTNAA